MSQQWNDMKHRISSLELDLNEIEPILDEVKTIQLGVWPSCAIILLAISIFLVKISRKLKSQDFLAIVQRLSKLPDHLAKLRLWQNQHNNPTAPPPGYTDPMSISASRLPQYIPQNMP